jgi:hypothetical protein
MPEKWSTTADAIELPSHRSICLRSSTGLFATSSVLGGAELGLGDAVDAVQRVHFDTDVFADDFGSDARIA